MLLDDQDLHGDSEQDGIENDQIDTDADDNEVTPADTDENGEPKKETAEEVKERQKKAWIENIKEGKKTLEDMPKNLDWLKKEVEAELPAPKKEVKPDELETRIRKTLQNERDAEDFDALATVLEESDLDENSLAEIQDTYKDLRADGVTKLKALQIAMKSGGLKDTQSMIRERRRKGMLLPPSGSVARKTVSKDGLTDMERKFMRDLPPSYEAKRK